MFVTIGNRRQPAWGHVWLKEFTTVALDRCHRWRGETVKGGRERDDGMERWREEWRNVMG